MKRIGKGEANKIFKRHRDAKWSAKHERSICGNGGRGWRSVYSANGTPVIVVEVTDCRDWGRVFSP